MDGQKDWKELEHEIVGAVELAKRPVAVAFLETAPAGVQGFEGTEPSGCSFWRPAVSGKAWTTVPIVAWFVQADEGLCLALVLGVRAKTQ